MKLLSLINLTCTHFNEDRKESDQRRTGYHEGKVKGNKWKKGLPLVGKVMVSNGQY